MSVHHAPLVAFPVRRSLLPTVLVLVVWLAGLALFWVWRGGLQGPDWRTLILACLLAATAAGVVWGTRQRATGQLQWDGTAWGWKPDRMPKQFEAASLLVVADLQRLIFVRLTLQHGQRLWFGVHRADFPERWLDFRRAIHFPGKPATLPKLPDGVSARALLPVAAWEPVVEPTEAPTPFKQ